MASRKDTAAAFFDYDVAPQTPAEMLAILQRFRDELVVAGGGNLPAAALAEHPQHGKARARTRTSEDTSEGEGEGKGEGVSASTRERKRGPGPG